MASKQEPRAIKLAFVGDIALGESPSSAGLGISRFLGESLYQQWRQYLAGLSPDFVLGNFEGTVSDVSHFAKSNIMHHSMRTDPESAGPLGTSGISHVSLANNHSNDHGPSALDGSLCFLRSQGIVAMEHFWQNGNVYEICSDGIRIGIIALNFVDTSMGHSDESIAIQPEEVPTLIARVKKHRRHFDHLIITVHWGENYGLWPNGLQSSLALEFVRAGASAIIGHHPHNIQDIRKVDGVPVVFSLGSFCFENKSPVTRLGQVVSLNCTKKAVTLESSQYISVGRDYRVSEELSLLQRQVASLVRRKPSKALNYIFVRSVRIWILVASLFRTLRAGHFGRYMKWVRHRYAKSGS